MRQTLRRADAAAARRGKHRIDYRHVIDWLVRKPGAFADYRYRDDLFPTSRFRMAYDVLRRATPHAADREYLRILHLAARESEARRGGGAAAAAGRRRADRVAVRPGRLGRRALATESGRR